MLVEEEDKLEDEPADDPLAGLDDLPVEVRERIQVGVEPQYEDSNHARARELRWPAHMREAAEHQLRLLVDDMNGRYQVADADAEVTRCLTADVVVEALTRDSLAELWDAFEREYRHLGFGQLAVVARHVLALPVSEAHAERLNQIIRRMCRKDGPRLRPRHHRRGVVLLNLCEVHSEI
jgi:hypothetical protein